MSLLGIYHKDKLDSEGSVLNIDSENIVAIAFKLDVESNGYLC